MTTEQICAAVRNLSRQALVELCMKSGVTYSTVAAIKYGRTKDPRGRTIDALKPFLEQK